MATELARARALLASRPDLATRLLVLAEPPKVAIVRAASDAAAVMAPLFDGRAEEALAVMALDRRGKVIATEILTSGGSDCFCIVDVRRIFRWALMQGKSGAAAIILAHNHPSGDKTPSEMDYDVTRRIAAAGRMLSIPLHDHLVMVDGGAYTSIAETGRGGIGPMDR